MGATLVGLYASRGRRGSRPLGMHPQRPPPHGRAAVWCSRRGRQWRPLHYRPTGNGSKASSPTPGRNRNPRRATPKKPAQILDSLHVDEVALVQMFQRKRGRNRPVGGQKGEKRGHLVHMFGKPKTARMSLLHAKTRLSVRRAFSDRECFDKETWWRKTSWHRNNGASDEAAGFDGRAFWTRETIWHRNSATVAGSRNGL